MSPTEQPLSGPTLAPSLERRLRHERWARKILDRIAWFGRKRGATAPVDLSETPRVGVLLQWGIGDAVLASPLMETLRRARPRATIVLIGKPWLGDLFQGSTLMDDQFRLVPPWTRGDEKYRLGTGAWRQYMADLRGLRRQRFDMLVSARFDARDVVQLRLLRANIRVGYGAAGGSRWLDVDLGAPPSRRLGLNVHRDAAEAARVITGVEPPSRPNLLCPKYLEHSALEELGRAGFAKGPLVVVSPSAGHEIRRWDPARFTKVIEDSASEIGFLVLLKDPSDPKAPTVRVPRNIPNMEWTSSLAELKGLLAHADVVLCCDSGVMHLASALGCRIVAVFGPGSPAWFGPAGLHDRVVLTEPMPCRPCFDQCIYPEPICMPVATADVHAAFRTALLEVSSDRAR